MNLLDDFLKALQAEDKSPHTIRAYKSDLAHFLRWYARTVGEEPRSVADITGTDIREYRAHLLNTARATPATVNRRLAALKRLAAWAQARGERPGYTIGRNGVRPVPREPLAPRWLERRQVLALLRAVERGGKKRDMAIVTLLLAAGLRAGELCSLRLADLTLGERSGSVVVRGKGQRYRTVPLSAGARRALREYLAVRPQAADDHLFLSRLLRPLTPNALQRLIAVYARQAGLEGVTPHTLRHTCAKDLLDRGANLVAVAALLGHSRLDTTRIYTAPSQADLQALVDGVRDG